MQVLITGKQPLRSVAGRRSNGKRSACRQNCKASGTVLQAATAEGKPDSAMAGAKDLNMLDEALAAVEKIVSEMVKA